MPVLKAAMPGTDWESWPPCYYDKPLKKLEDFFLINQFILIGGYGEI